MHITASLSGGSESGLSSLSGGLIFREVDIKRSARGEFHLSTAMATNVKTLAAIEQGEMNCVNLQ